MIVDEHVVLQSILQSTYHQVLKFKLNLVESIRFLWQTPRLHLDLHEDFNFVRVRAHTDRHAGGGGKPAGDVLIYSL